MAASNTRDRLRNRLEEIKVARGDQISIDDVGEVVSSIMDTLQGDIGVVDLDRPMPTIRPISTRFSPISINPRA